VNSGTNSQRVDESRFRKRIEGLFGGGSTLAYEQSGGRGRPPHIVQLQRAHIRQELAIRLGFVQLVDEQFHGFHR